MSTAPERLWQPLRESPRATVLRTGMIALLVGGAIAGATGQFTRWPLLSVLVLWFSLGGHFVELLFLNVLRPRIPRDRLTQVAVRLATWFFGGAVLTLGVGMTALAVEGHAPRWSEWWLGGLAFIGVELIVHLVLGARRIPNFYDGRA